MLASFLIMLREGLEASLIVVIIASYLRRTDRRDMLRPMWIGVLGAALVCLAVGVGLHLASQELPHAQQELLEAIVGFATVGVLTWMVFWMRKAGRGIKGELEGKLDSALGAPGTAAVWGMIAMAFFAVLREGFESALFLLAAFEQGGASAGVGAFLGTAVAVGLGFGIYKGTVRLDLRRFFLFTGAVIIVFGAGLLAQSLHALHEAGLWNALQDTAWDTSGLVSNSSTAGNILRGLLAYQATPTVGEAIVYWAYLLPVGTWFFFGDRISAWWHARRGDELAAGPAPASPASSAVASSAVASSTVPTTSSARPAPASASAAAE